jgi:hypothetical protein
MPVILLQLDSWRGRGHNSPVLDKVRLVLHVFMAKYRGRESDPGIHNEK